MTPPDLPLQGLTVVDMSQFLSGPYCSLRLLDLGARVIKVERPDGGDLSRQLYLSDTEIGGDSTIFHAINRGKESIAIDLKSEADLDTLRSLLAQADVMIQNFRPGVIERLGLSYAAVKEINPAIVYGSITGYGMTGPWVKRPGQDLLAQARSGVMWLNGDAAQGPVPIGLAVGDMLAGAALCQGILAALVGRGISGKGRHVETSLLEALVDLQFEVLTTHLNDGERAPRRADYRSAHAYLSAPYGVYPTADGFIAVAMTPVGILADLLDIPALDVYRDTPSKWFTERDQIKAIIAERLVSEPTDHWMGMLDAHDIWCSEVLDWRGLMGSDGFKVLDILQTVTRADDVSIRTTRSPIRIDGHRSTNSAAAPQIGEHSEIIRKDFNL
ncbi:MULTISPECIES: CaiB/BaiF CoA transferase family protein [Roseobacteraceae]|uniref:Acetyl-CoA:oxalate CoA-transferase n=1 Tax=Pseudosulfitobacter pseudonitzschiae TaxID=1402135 RepID=A0A221K5N2_9RHOB|nr:MULTISPECIES: CaiB/BaiF CoA-transferase family protein [Roseobacteraceae]ASM74296.1 acetyl-CoA:oxalate CoA-transferase [Pseudosulfitobacter pseudonitzschiae]